MKKENILILFGADSKLEWGTSFQVAKALLKLGNDILYVELPQSILNKPIDKYKVTDGIKVLSPHYGLPYGRIELLTWLNRHIICHQIDKFILNNNFKPTFLWIYAPYDYFISKYILRKYQIDRSVYHSAGDRVALAYQRGGQSAAKKIKIYEDKIHGIVNYIIVENMTHKNDKYNTFNNIKVLPSGIDRDLFDASRSHDMPIEYDSAKKRLLYMGTVEVWTDLELIKKCAATFTDANIYLVGPVRNNVDVTCISNIDNIVFVGNKPYITMPKYISNSDVCLIPFKNTPSLKYSSTLKALQYLSLYKPVVSTYYEGINGYDKCVSVANSDNEFIELVKHALDGNINNNFNKKDIDNILAEYEWTSLVTNVINEM